MLPPSVLFLLPRGRGRGDEGQATASRWPAIPIARCGTHPLCTARIPHTRYMCTHTGGESTHPTPILRRTTARIGYPIAPIVPHDATFSRHDDEHTTGGSQARSSWGESSRWRRGPCWRLIKSFTLRGNQVEKGKGRVWGEMRGRDIGQELCLSVCVRAYTRVRAHTHMVHMAGGEGAVTAT